MGFNHLAYVGLPRAEQQLGIQGKVLTSNSGADYLPNLTTLARQGYNLIIPVGFLMADATDTVAKAFPSAKFAMVDSDATAEKGDPKNIEGLLFKEQQAGYLAGYLAGLYAKAKGYKTISSVGGQKLPPVDHYIAGYQAGAKAADPGITHPQRLFAGLHRPGQVQEHRAQPDPAGIEGRLPGGRWVRARSAVRGAAAGRTGHRGRRRPIVPGLVHPDLGREEGRQRGVQRDQEPPGRSVRSGHERHQRHHQRRHRLREDRTRGATFAPEIQKIYDEIKSGQISNIPYTVP